MISGFQLAVGSAGRIGLVVEAAVGDRPAEALMEEQKQECDIHPLTDKR